MKYAWEELKRNILLYSYRRRVSTLHTYLTQAAVVDLTSAEQDFIDAQTSRLLARKTARQQRINPAQDWTASLPAMPRRGFAHAVYVAR